MKYIVERLLTNAQRMDTDMVSDVEAKIESLKGKTIEVPLDFLYKLQEFLIASSCMHDEDKLPYSFTDIASKLGYEILDMAKDEYCVLDLHPASMYSVYEIVKKETYAESSSYEDEE